jgi:hypothetical protein
MKQKWSDVFDYDYDARRDRFRAPRRLAKVEAAENMFQYTRLEAYAHWMEAELVLRAENKALQFAESFSQEVDE